MAAGLRFHCLKYGPLLGLLSAALSQPLERIAIFSSERVVFSHCELQVFPLEGRSYYERFL